MRFTNAQLIAISKVSKPHKDAVDYLVVKETDEILLLGWLGQKQGSEKPTRKKPSHKYFFKKHCWYYTMTPLKYVKKKGEAWTTTET